MVLTLLGLPAAGKGTQAKKIAQEYNLTHISTGDIFRGLVKEETPLGDKIRKYIDQGKLVPDEDTIRILRERLEEIDLEKGFVLDGFPRTLNQAEALTGILSNLGICLDMVFYLQVDKRVLVHRLSGRRVCPNCGATYHLVYNKPEKEGICDRCNHQLVQRTDDQPETLEKRLQASADQLDKLIEYYREQGVLKTIPSEDIESVFSRIQDTIEVNFK